MTVSKGLRTVAEAIDALEDAGVAVVDADTDDLVTEEGVSVRVSAAFDLPAVDVEGVAVTPDAATVEDGEVRVDLTVTANGGDTATGDDEASEADGNDDADEGTPPHRDPERLREVYAEHDSFAAMTEALGVDVAPNTVRRNMIKHGIHDPEDDEGDEGDEGTPSHRDPERLREVYAEHDSFAAMTEALGADVTPQTVRRNMIEHGIHEPESADGEAPETPLTDGIDLPDGTGLEDLKAAVASGRTVREVGQALGVERERARRLLSELDLLELVTGRLAAEREIDPEEIDRRIAGASPSGA